MPDGIMIAVTVVLVIAGVIISHFVTVSNLRKNAESKIGNAESKAREIIDDAKKSLSRTRMNLKKRQRNAELNYSVMRSVYFPRKRLWTRKQML